MAEIEQLTYEKAVTELDQILRTIQSDNCDIDKLTTLTRRATELLSTCRKRLTSTEAELRQILSSLEEGEKNAQ